MTRRIAITTAVLAPALAAQTLTSQSGVVSAAQFTVGPDVNQDEQVRVVCDKCGSDRIEYRLKTPPKVKDVKLSEWVNQPAISSRLAIMRYAQYIAECKKCHFSVEYSRPW
jgi:hypothetical protein